MSEKLIILCVYLFVSVVMIFQGWINIPSQRGAYENGFAVFSGARVCQLSLFQVQILFFGTVTISGMYQIFCIALPSCICIYCRQNEPGAYTCFASLIENIFLDMCYISFFVCRIPPLLNWLKSFQQKFHQMPDNGSYDVAVVPGSQDGQGKVCYSESFFII